MCDLRVREAYESYCSKGIERCVILGSGRHMRVTATKEHRGEWSQVLGGHICSVSMKGTVPKEQRGEWSQGQGGHLCTGNMRVTATKEHGGEWSHVQGEHICSGSMKGTASNGQRGEWCQGQGDIMNWAYESYCDNGIVR